MAVQLLKASLWVPDEAAARTAGATTSTTASTCTAETACVPVPHVAIVLLWRLPAVPAADGHAVPDDGLR